MLVYLMRHGEAVSEDVDSQRPLSDRGEGKIRDLAHLLASQIGLMPGYIFHSPRLRAAQTASIMSQALPGTPAPEETTALGPMDDPAIWSERIQSLEKDTLLVGHLPHLSRLASLLLLWDSGRELLDFKTGTVVCLERTGNWRVRWMIGPDVFKSG